jgi:hypothetical protein
MSGYLAVPSLAPFWSPVVFRREQRAVSERAFTDTRGSEMATETDQETKNLPKAEGTPILDEAGEKSFVFGSIFFFALVFSPFILFLVLKVFKVIKEESADDFNYAAMQWLGAFSVAAGFGALGVWTSFLSRRNDLLKPAKISFGYTIILAYLLGCVLGCILLLLFVGNFLSGNLFPDFNTGDKSFINLGIHLTDWAKIMIWCFVSGFSERLIPDFLDNLVAKVTAKRG